MQDPFSFKYAALGPNVPACHCQSRKLCKPFFSLARSLVLSPLFSFSLWGRSGIVPECLSELMAFLSRENWSSRIITVIPLFSSRICSEPTEHVSAPHCQHNPPWHFRPPGPTLSASFHTFRWGSTSRMLKESRWLPHFSPPCICIIHECFTKPPDSQF